MTNEELWRAALGEIELSISKANFVTWFKNTSITNNSSGKVIISVPNGFAKEWLENKYNIYILKALRNLQPDIKEISCIINTPKEAPTDSSPNPNETDESPATQEKTDSPAIHSQTITGRNHSETNLNSRYTFDNYVVGEHNELAKAACYAVSKDLGTAFNPLFIYGGVGLGKTHLMQSIGNEVYKKNPDLNIKYVTSERFATALIESLGNQTISDFKNYYQKIDLLIIDDIQFLSGKEKTQHEFFHIFNALYQLNKQIVISSDRPPSAISTLEDRLKSRFEGGMIADIGRPDLETRMAILRNKAAEKNFFVEDDAIRFIAESIVTNVRELEGALNRIIAHAQLQNKMADMTFVQQLLSEMVTSKRNTHLSFDHILKIISDFYNITPEQIIGKGRKKEIVVPRQLFMYLLRTELELSYPSIGDKIGGRDHTTVLHAYEKMNNQLSQDSKLKEELEILKEKIYSK